MRWLDGIIDEFAQSPGYSKRQGSLASMLQSTGLPRVRHNLVTEQPQGTKEQGR